MIDPKTLRLGNLVRHKKSIYEVISIDSEWLQLDNDQLNTLAEQVEPIILTGDILFQSGFFKTMGKKEWSIDLYGNNSLVCEMHNDGTFNFYLVNEFVEAFKDKLGQYNYLHQVQNLYFAIDGFELTISLTT